jgi:general secretion pathway protein C
LLKGLISEIVNYVVMLIVTATRVSSLLAYMLKNSFNSSSQFNRSIKVNQAQVGFVQTLSLVKVIIALSLVFWIAASLSSVIWRILPEPTLADIIIPDNVSAFAPVNSQTRASVDIDQLKSIALFGKESTEVSVVVAVPVEIIEQVEETRLNLKLLGSYANSNKDLGYAIIAKGRDQELYKVGDEIAGLNNVSLVGVYSERIVLTNNGKREALYMFPEGESYASASISSSAPVDRNQSLSEDINALEIEDDLNLQTISDVMRFSRKTEDGKMVGFIVMPGRNPQVFDQTGLQLNDVVVAIDGQLLDNLKAANSIYQQKRAATQASLQVLRGEEELTIDIDLNNINLN